MIGACKHAPYELNEEVDTLVDMVEPYLLKEGLVGRTRQGRIAMDRAYQALGKKAPRRKKSDDDQPELFADGDPEQ